MTCLRAGPSMAPRRSISRPMARGANGRYILHCPSLHLDVGPGKLNGVVGRVRLSSAIVWEYGPVVAVAKRYDLLLALYEGMPCDLQVSEAHRCCNVAGWDITLYYMRAFISRFRPPLTPMVVHGADPDRLMMGGWEPGARVAKAQILRRSIQVSFGPEGGPSGSRTHDLRV